MSQYDIETVQDMPINIRVSKKKFFFGIEVKIALETVLDNDSDLTDTTSLSAPFTNFVASKWIVVCRRNKLVKLMLPASIESERAFRSRQ